MKFKTLKRNNQVSAIVLAEDLDKRNDTALLLQQKLNIIDQKLSKVASELLEAQTVSLRSRFSSNVGLFNSLRKQWVTSAANESAQWHKDRLIALRKERKQIQTELDKVSGNFWTNRIKTWAYIAITFCIICFFVWVLFLGLITAIYFLPIWGSILFIYLFLKKNK